MARFGPCARFSIDPVRIVSGSHRVRSPLRKKRGHARKRTPTKKLAVEPSYLEDLPLLAALALCWAACPAAFALSCAAWLPACTPCWAACVAACVVD